MIRRPPRSTLFPYTTLFRSGRPGRAPERFLPLDITSLLLHVVSKRSEERFSRNAETDLVCRLLLEKKKPTSQTPKSNTNLHPEHNPSAVQRAFCCTRAASRC